MPPESKKYTFYLMFLVKLSPLKSGRNPLSFFILGWGCLGPSEVTLGPLTVAPESKILGTPLAILPTWVQVFEIGWREGSSVTGVSCSEIA